VHVFLEVESGTAASFISKRATYENHS